jgi:serine/threonine protein phosphatase PrpC
MEVTQFSAQNKRYYQEDRSFAKKTTNGLFLGVFDGHGGKWVAEYAAEHTPFLFRSVRKTVKANSEETLRQIFKTLAKDTSDYGSGSTASIVWVRDNVAHVAILGDSPVMIRDENGNVWHSPEHNIRTNKPELEAAIARGGKSDGNYLFDKWRIDGPGLQMSRALGDKELNRVLNREPEIFHIPLGKNSWILACSDGLIDPSHKDAEIDKIVIEFIEHGADAEELVLAMANIQKDDNSTAIVVRMD